METQTRPTTDRARFESTVLPLAPTLYGRALRLCQDADQADDLVQDTVIRAWRFWASYQQGSNASAWLRRILTNSFISECRRDQRRRQLSKVLDAEPREVSCSESPAVAVDEGFGDEVHAALAALPEEYRSVLLLVDVQGFGYREAAAELGCPVGTIMSRLHRARRAARMALGSYAETVGFPDAGRAFACA